MSLADVAQWIAHLASDQKAAGSSPAVRDVFLFVYVIISSWLVNDYFMDRVYI